MGVDRYGHVDADEVLGVRFVEGCGVLMGMGDSSVSGGDSERLRFD